MKRRLPFFVLFMAAAAVSFAAGAMFQQKHAFRPIRRFMRGLPAAVSAPSTTLLDWDTQQTKTLLPHYELSALRPDEIEKNKPLYTEKLRMILEMSRFPSDFQPQIQRTEQTDLGKVLREKILIETEPGLKIPFYLLIPKGPQQPRPFILVLHGHSAGKMETAGLVESYQHRNALALAEAGFVTAAPDFRGFGELGWEGDWDDPEGHSYGKNIHVQDVLNNLQRGRTVLGTYLYDLNLILNYLAGRPEIDRKRIGVAGTSMGADTAIWLSIMDPRIKAIAASHAPMTALPNELRYQDEYHACIDTLPGLENYFRPEEIILLTAGTPLFLAFNESRHSARIYSQLEKLYGEKGSPDKLSSQIHHGGESFDSPAAIAWFRKWL